MSQKQKLIGVVLSAIAILLGVLIWEQVGIGDAATRRQVELVSITIGVPLIGIVAMRGWIALVKGMVGSNAPELYGYVKWLGETLLGAVMLSITFVTTISVMLHSRHNTGYAQFSLVVATAMAGWIASLCWRYVWNACIAVRMCRHKLRRPAS